MQKSSLLLGVLFSITVAVMGALVVYLTPLKNIALIEPTVRDISSIEFQQKFSENPDRYIFIDVRSEEAYNKKHAVGSVNIPLHVLYDERKFLPKRGKEIVLICSGGRASGVGFSYLEHYGFLNVHRIEGGIEAWEAANLPVGSIN